MAKERKTKRQKKASDLRRSHTAVPDQTETLYQLDLKSEKEIKTTKPQAKQSFKEYTYLTRDLRKTGLVTGMIVMFELGVYFISVSS